jgi:hypothetical protein
MRLCSPSNKDIRLRSGLTLQGLEDMTAPEHHTYVNIIIFIDFNV